MVIKAWAMLIHPQICSICDPALMLLIDCEGIGGMRVDVPIEQSHSNRAIAVGISLILVTASFTINKRHIYSCECAWYVGMLAYLSIGQIRCHNFNNFW